MVTMDESLREMLRQGLITREMALYYSENPDLLGG